MIWRGAQFVFLLLTATGQASEVSAADKASPAVNDFFETEIRPLLAERCHKCHGENKPKSGLRLTSRAAVLKGGDTGPAAVPNMPDDSLLIQAVRHEGDLKMPPNEKLTPAQIELLVRWIKLGLPWPEHSPDKAVTVAKQGEEYQISEEQRKFWSFQPPKVVSGPQVNDTDWCRSRIDPFILAALEARGLGPARPADKRTLIRRATFDLTGLPPTPAEVDAFLADQ
jgi:hypothetical protein